jgi:hypothetical protein
MIGDATLYFAHKDHHSCLTWISGTGAITSKFHKISSHQSWNSFEVMAPVPEIQVVVYDPGNDKVGSKLVKMR